MFNYFYNLKDKIKISQLRQDRFILINTIFAIVLNVVIWLVLFLNIDSSSEFIPLHYNIYFGIDLIGPWYKVFVIPILGLVVFFINLLLSYIIKIKVLSYFLIGSSVFAQFILLIGSIFVILLNL